MHHRHLVLAASVLIFAAPPADAAPPRSPRTGRVPRARPSKPARSAARAAARDRNAGSDYKTPVSARARPVAKIRAATRLPKPKGVTGKCNPQWDSVALFYNVNPGGPTPKGYKTTTVAFAKQALDEGPDALTPGVSEFVCNYWRTVSRGKIAFGLDAPRDAAGDPIIGTTDGGSNWGSWIKPLFDQNAEAIWKAAGSLTIEGKRWVPHIVLMNRFGSGGQAQFKGFERTVGGKKYRIDDVMSIGVQTKESSPVDAPAKKGRKFWRVLLHEYAHNFLEMRDLYGPHGCTGYWDLLGDNSPAGRVSEISAAHVERIGWLKYHKVIKGPTEPRSISMLPYTTSRQAIKVVPDPVNTPDEYYVLEFRKSTGAEVWRPDGALEEQGLLITHYNNRVGIPRTWLNRDAPYFDPEFADGSDGGGAEWTGHEDLAGKLFPQGQKNAFTPTSFPSSNFYDGRKSGLYVTDIRVAQGRVHFKLMVSGTDSKVAWTTSGKDRAVAGHFTPGSHKNGGEIFLRSDNEAALLQHRSSQWGVDIRVAEKIGGWGLGKADWESVGDLDGDGLDEIWIRSAKWAGVLEVSGNKLRLRHSANAKIGRWPLSGSDKQLIADFDGDGRDEVYLRQGASVGLVRAPRCGPGATCPAGGKLSLATIQGRAIGGWPLSGADNEVVASLRRGNKPEIVVWRNGRIGLFTWSETKKKLVLAAKHVGTLGGWALSKNDRVVAGDFDGDGVEELFIRSAAWAGLIEVAGGKFVLKWAAKGPLSGVTDVSLSASDSFYGGRFRIEKDCILHRQENGKLRLLVWNGVKMNVEQVPGKKLSGLWTVGASDRFVIADFHPLDPDPSTQKYVTDGISDVFIHNAEGTAMLGFNPLKKNPTAGKDRRYGLTWVSGKKLLRRP